MTTLGKILVFLVFVAALAMGGMMVFVARTTPNWKAAADQRDQAISVYKEMLKQEALSRERLVNENEKLKQLLDGKSVESQGVAQRLKSELTDLAKQIRAAEEQRGKSDMLAKQAQDEAVRLQKELEFTQNVSKDRETTIVKLQTEIVTARNEEQAAKNDVVTMKNRIQSLEAIAKEKDRLLADLSRKGLPTTTGVASTGVRDATYRNPPSVLAKGQVEQIDDRGLVKISIGSDAGVRKDHTLEVFRLSPKAEFLGWLLVVESDFHFSMGRMLPQPGVAAPALRPGDQVASSLRK